MASEPANLNKRNKALFWGFIFVSLLPWLYLRAQQTVPTDMLWLYEAMTRVFHGASMSDAAYETNPPLSLLLYLPSVLLREYAGLTFQVTCLLQSLLILAAGFAALKTALKHFAFLNDYHVTMVLAGYLLANTLCTNILFGERDHLIGMALPAFVLFQIALTRKTLKATPLIWLFLLLSSALFLLKPHFGIIPLALLAHRLWTQGPRSVLRAPDFQALTFVTIGYLGILTVFFLDDLQIIMPDVIRYYLPVGNTDADLAGALMINSALGFALLALTWITFPDKAQRRFYAAFVILGLACLIPVALQGKGFSYHYFPAVTFYFCALLPVVFTWLNREIRQPLLALGFVAITFVALLYFACPLGTTHATYKNFSSLPLPELIEERAKTTGSDSFFISNSQMSLLHETAYYTDLTHASRFPSLWFLPGLYMMTDRMNDGLLSPQETAQLERDIYRFGTMMADDLNNYRPGTVLILEHRPGRMTLDPVAFFKGHRLFREAWAHYSPVGTIDVREKDYYGDIIINGNTAKTFQIYERKR